MILEHQTQSLRLSRCHRHPAEPVTGFCAACLRERLAGLESPVHTGPSSTFKTILENSGSRLPDRASRRTNAAAPAAAVVVAEASSTSPELRRSKSCSHGKCEASSGFAEPRRKSCDVRARKCLQHLFSADDGKNGDVTTDREEQSRKLGFPILADPVFETRGYKVAASEDVLGENGNVEEDLKTMKEHIDLELRTRKQTGRELKDIAGSFLVAASVFSKKLQRWKQKQKVKKPNHGNVGDSSAVDVEKKLNGRQVREAQPEVADYRFGRRSCDVDRRFSVEAGRISLDDPRFSLDEHRASWDGYLIARTIPRLTPMLSVIENVMMAPVNRIPAEDQMNSINEDETNSRGSAQTRDCCSDSSSSQRGSSFDCSSSAKSFTKKTLEVDEMKSVSNLSNAKKVSPGSVEVLHGSKLLIRDDEFGDLNSSSYQDGGCKSFKSAPNNVGSAVSGGNSKGVKKSKRWNKVLNIWGYFNGTGEKNCEEMKGNAIDCHPEECCEKWGGEGNGVVKGNSSPKITRSSSCVTSRISNQMIESNNNTRNVNETAESPMGVREESDDLGNGLARFYMTPLRSYGSKSGKSRLRNSLSVARELHS